MPTIPVLLVSLFFFAGGISHFVMADFFVNAMPTYLPYHLELVYISGAFELLGAAGMLVPQTRLFAAYGLMALCVAVFPANINMAKNAYLFTEIPEILLYLRLPLQAVFIWFIWWSVSDYRDKKDESDVLVPPLGSQLERVCKEFIAAFNGLLQWKWDDRYQLALAEFGVDNEEVVMATLERYFRHLWDMESIAAAPSLIRSVINDMGGLKAGQLLFTSDAIEDTFIYCMLWPWGNRKTISIRISPLYKDLTEAEKQQQIQQVKDWFGIGPTKSGWIKVENNAVPAN